MEVVFWRRVGGEWGIGVVGGGVDVVVWGVVEAIVVYGLFATCTLGVGFQFIENYVCWESSGWRAVMSVFSVLIDQ